MVDPTIVKIVKQYLSNLDKQGVQVEYGVIFGSQARGQVDQWSDIDLLVVSHRFDKQCSRADVNLLWRVAARTDSRIEPIPVGAQQYHQDQSSHIIEIARREGAIIPF